MIREIPSYQAVCDRCGCVFDDGEYEAWSSAETALEVALDSDDWQGVDANGAEVYGSSRSVVTLLCGECWTWSEDGERIIAKPAEEDR